MDVLLAEAGLIGFILGMIRKFELDNRVTGILYKVLVCNLCTVWWISLIVCLCFGNPFHAITISGLWMLVASL